MKRIAFLVIISAIAATGMNIQAEDWSSSRMYQPATTEMVNPLYEAPYEVSGYGTTGGTTGYMPTGKETRQQQEMWRSSPFYAPQTQERMNPMYESRFGR